MTRSTDRSGRDGPVIPQTFDDAGGLRPSRVTTSCEEVLQEDARRVTGEPGADLDRPSMRTWRPSSERTQTPPHGIKSGMGGRLADVLDAALGCVCRGGLSS